MQFRVLRKKGTEMAGSSPLDKSYKEGTYDCAGCDTPLYTSKQRFVSACGWPSFFESIPGAIKRHEDRTFGMKRVEITCAGESAAGAGDEGGACFKLWASRRGVPPSNCTIRQTACAKIA